MKHGSFSKTKGVVDICCGEVSRDLKLSMFIVYA